MQRLLRPAAAAAVLLGLAGAAAAQPFGSGRPDMFLRGVDFVAIDTDGDGSLSRTELQARAVARLSPADANGDGIVDRAELIAFLPAPDGGIVGVFAADPAERMADRILALLGATETGQVQLTELVDARVNLALARADTDRDAAISRDEAQAIGERGRHHGRHHGRNGGPDGRPGGGPGPRGAAAEPPAPPAPPAAPQGN